MLYREIASCRSCYSTNLKPVLDLKTPYISDFIAPGGQEDRAPLEVVMCRDCTLVQLRHTVDRERLYRNYYYRSSTNESMVAALKDVATDACNRVYFESGDRVLDIGCNDGTLLGAFPSYVNKHGFEPSSIATDAMGIDMLWQDFFPSDKMGTPLRKYKVITSIACFYDVDDPNGFVSVIKDWLHPDGVWVCQMQDYGGMLVTTGFDNICHEHLCYWTQQAFERLLNRNGLHIEAASNNTVNGASVRYIVKHGARKLPEFENGHFFHEIQMRNFAYRVDVLRRETLSLLVELAATGKKVLGYGASTKGSTLLQYYGITPDLLPAIADRNIDKWGKQMVGSHIPIISEDLMREIMPDYLFVLPWHFVDSFLDREEAFLRRGGQFIVPMPRLYTVGGDRCRQYFQEEVYANH